MYVTSRSVFLNLDTTGLPTKDTLPDLILIAAICGDRSFERYIVPPVPVSKEATEITGFTSDKEMLFLNGVKMETVPLKDALSDFLTWLGQLDSVRPILISHCGKIFHAPVLCNGFKKSGLLGTAEQCIGGFVDSQEMAKDVIPAGEVEDYHLITMAEKFLQDVDKTHNSIHRVRILKSLFESTLASKVDIEKYCFTVSQACPEIPHNTDMA